MSRRRHPATPVTVRRLGVEPEIVSASEFAACASIGSKSAIADIDPPRLLRIGSGYTTIPALALRDEREAVSEEEQDEITAQVRMVENIAHRDAEHLHVEKVAALERDLAEVIAHARKHRLATYRQCDAARRAVAALIRSDIRIK